MPESGFQRGDAGWYGSEEGDVFGRGGPKEEKAKRGWILVVDDEPDAASEIESALVVFPWPVRAVTGTQEARAILAGDARVTAVLVDLVFPDEPHDAAFDFLEDALSMPSHPACAAISKTLRPDYINRVMALGAAYISKFELFTWIPEFVRRAVVSAAVPDQRLQNVTYQFARTHKLSPRETEVLALITAEMTRDGICDRLGIRKGTVKSHVRSILDKSRQPGDVGYSRVDDLARDLRRAAIVTH